MSMINAALTTERWQWQTDLRGCEVTNADVCRDQRR